MIKNLLQTVKFHSPRPISIIGISESPYRKHRKKGSEDMDMKITRNYAAYQNAVSNAKHTEKNSSTPAPAAGKARGDVLCISCVGA